MWSLAQPSPATLQRFLEASRDAPLSYEAVGCTSANCPAGYSVDRQRVRIGHGAANFAKASAAIRRWEMFYLGWLRVDDPGRPIAVGETVAVIARVGLTWSVNACRIVQVIDEPRRFGFAYGTLASHVERGEERFLIEEEADGSVWYDLHAMSRPAHWYVWLGFPVTRWYQKRFRTDSAAAMRAAMR